MCAVVAGNNGDASGPLSFSVGSAYGHITHCVLGVWEFIKGIDT